ncbi:MAG: hypothetical protein Q8P59_07080 [Dehalococcoidia bacterium]|nr:hypothetical protein [Dehalococcoidia bacterium]
MGEFYNWDEDIYMIGEAPDVYLEMLGDAPEIDLFIRMPDIEDDVECFLRIVGVNECESEAWVH